MFFTFLLYACYTHKEEKDEGMTVKHMRAEIKTWNTWPSSSPTATPLSPTHSADVKQVIFNLWCPWPWRLHLTRALSLFMLLSLLYWLIDTLMCQALSWWGGMHCLRHLYFCSWNTLTHLLLPSAIRQEIREQLSVCSRHLHSISQLANSHLVSIYLPTVWLFLSVCIWLCGIGSPSSLLSSACPVSPNLSVSVSPYLPAWVSISLSVTISVSRFSHPFIQLSAKCVFVCHTVRLSLSASYALLYY